jgi:hypothetical protein
MTTFLRLPESAVTPLFRHDRFSACNLRRLLSIIYAMPEKAQSPAVSLHISPDYVRGRLKHVVGALVVAYLVLSGILLLLPRENAMPDFPLSGMVALLVGLAVVLGIVGYLGHRMVMRHLIILGPTAFFCSSSTAGALSHTLAYGAEDPLVLSQDALGRFWHMATRSCPKPRFRIPVAAYPELEMFLNASCRHFISEAPTDKPPVTSD